MRRTMIAAAIVGALAVITPCYSFGEDQSADPARVQMSEKCTVCHLVSKVLSQHHDRAGWIKVVWFRMRQMDPGLFANYTDAEPLIDYLARDRGR